MAGAQIVHAQVSFTGSYSEDFNSMGTSGTTAPAGWSVFGALGGDKDSWSAATGIPAAGSPSAASGTVDAVLLATTPGTSNTRGFNIASPTLASDRSLGSSPTGGAGIILQLRLTNNTGAPVSSILIGYDIRRLTAPSTTEALPGYRLFVSSDAGANWTNISSLNPTLSGGAVNVPNSIGVTTVPLTAIALPSAVAQGSEIRMRWVDDNGPPSPDQVISLDNVVINLPQPAPLVSLTAPVGGASYDLPATIHISADATDSNGSVTKVEFFANGTKIGEDASAPYELAWTGMISGDYSLTAVATDNDGANTTSEAVGITVANPSNVPPLVAITTPSNGELVAGSSALLSASATDGDGVVTKVEFFQGSTKLGEDTSFPYTFNWTGVATGTYSVTARATDNDGGFTVSEPVSVTFVVPVETEILSRRPAGSPGMVWKYLDDRSNQGTAWKEPGYNDSAWASGAAPLGYGDSHIVTTINSGPSGDRIITTYLRRSFNLTGAEAVRALSLNILRDDGVVVYINGTEVARQNMPEGPINYLTNAASIVDGANETTYFNSTVTTLPPLNEGENIIAVELHNRDGNSSDLGFDLELISLSLPGEAPTVSLTSPAQGASYTAPATIGLTAVAGDSDGSVVKVEFLNGTEVLGEDAEAPYAFDWTRVPQGSYTLTARATDNFGLTALSEPVEITVGPPNTVPPVVAVTSPSTGARFINPATIVLEAAASDSDGTVEKVEFFNGPVKLGEDSSPPYSFTWENVEVGSYTITAVATDDQTATTVSAPVIVEVVPNQAPAIFPAAPADGQNPAGASGVVTLSANVEDPEGQELTVTFYGRRKSPAPGPDFTLVTLPDTQYYSENSGGSRLQHFTSQTNWIVANRTALNIPFVAHMGDMVNTASVAQEWTNAKIAMSIIEDPVTTTLLDGIPWGGAPGNHDGTGSEWDTHFGPGRFNGRTYYQGGYNNSNRNNYQFFSASGLDFIIINLAYNSSTSGNQAVTDWADALLKAHPNRRAIITSHWLIGISFPPTQAAWGGHGQMVYDNLKDNPNLFMMLCGHIHGEGRRVDTYEGRTVNTILQDYQSRSNGGDSWLRYFVFSPANNTITAKTYQTRTGTFETDADSQFTLDYDMSDASGPWTPIGTVTLAPGETTASVAWNGLDRETEYEWYAAVTDGPNSVGGAVRSFTTAPQSAYDDWKLAHAGDINTPDSDDGEDRDGLGLLLEYAFGLNPSVADATPVSFDIPGNQLLVRGTPAVHSAPTPDGRDFRAVFVRRKGGGGLIYTPQFSHDLTQWTDSTVTPTVIASDADMELVSVRYPLFVNGRKARFFRIAVTQAP